MGSNLCRTKRTLTVDDETKKNRKERVREFSPGIFIKRDFEVFKAFCIKYGIAQKDVVVVFNSYLSTNEAYLRDFRVKILDLKLKFFPHTKLTQEIADIFLPALFMKDIQGLDDAYSSEEVSFTRFVMVSFFFCCQQTPDVLLDLIMVLKKNFNLKLETKIFYHNFYEILVLLIEEKKCYSSQIVLNSIKNEAKDKELTIQSIIRIGIKYPILFYALEKFKRMYRRYVFGDKFWQNKKHLKLRQKAALHVHMDVRYNFSSIENSIAFTAVSIITDAVNAAHSNEETVTVFRHSDHIHPLAQRLSFVGKDEAVILKDVFGYKHAKHLLVESGLGYSEDVQFLWGFDSADVEETEKEHEIKAMDADTGHHFTHDPSSGETKWGQLYFNEDDSIFKEAFLHC